MKMSTIQDMVNTITDKMDLIEGKDQVLYGYLWDLKIHLLQFFAKNYYKFKNSEVIREEQALFNEIDRVKEIIGENEELYEKLTNIQDTILEDKGNSFFDNEKES